MSSSVGLQFKVKPRPNYNNFPAIKQIESRIAKLPYEEGWLFDGKWMTGRQELSFLCSV